MLGHLYAAEALVLMDKLTDAVDHLNPDLITDIGVDFPKDETADEEDICKNTKPASSEYSWNYQYRSISLQIIFY